MSGEKKSELRKLKPTELDLKDIERYFTRQRFHATLIFTCVFSEAAVRYPPVKRVAPLVWTGFVRYNYVKSVSLV